MKIFFYILILWPSILFGQYQQNHIKSSVKNGSGADTVYGAPLRGYLLYSTAYSNDGKITNIIQYKNYMKNGMQIQFFNYPYDTASVEHYKNDILNGSYFYRYKNGKLSEKGVYKNGGVYGKVDRWNELGEKFADEIKYNEKKHLFYSNDTLCNGKMPINVAADLYFTQGKMDSVNTFSYAWWGVSDEVKRNYLDSTRKYYDYYESGNLRWINHGRIISYFPNNLDVEEGKTYFTEDQKVVLEGKWL